MRTRQTHPAIFCASLLFLLIVAAIPANSQDGADSKLFKAFFEAQNKADLKTAVALTAGSAAKSIGGSFAHSKAFGIRFGEVKAVRREVDKLAEGFSLYDVTINATRAGSDEEKQMILVAITTLDTDNKLRIAFFDRKGELGDAAPPLEAYQSKEPISLEEAEKQFTEATARFEAIQNRGK